MYHESAPEVGLLTVALSRASVRTALMPPEFPLTPLPCRIHISQIRLPT